MSRTLATKSSSQGILLCRNIQDKAASEYVPRLARAKRAQQMELVINTAVRQKANHVRCKADRPWCGLCWRIASSTDATKALIKGKGLPISIEVPGIEWAKIPWGLIDTFCLTNDTGASYNGMKVAGRTVYRRRMGQSRYLELDRSTQLPLRLAKR